MAMLVAGIDYKLTYSMYNHGNVVCTESELTDNRGMHEKSTLRSVHYYAKYIDRERIK